jgi:hypothetical protein
MTNPPSPPPLPLEQFGPVVITAREIYDAIVRVSSKVDLLGQQMAQVGSDQKDQEARILALERGRWPLPSLAVLASFAAVFVAIFFHH